MWVHRLLPQHNSGLNLLRSSNDFKRLSQLTDLPTEKLYSLTLHRFAPYFYLPDELARLKRKADDLERSYWSERGLCTYVHGSKSHKVCPICWDEHHTLLLPWMLRHVTTCARHNVLLVDRCSQCGQRLEIVPENGSCARCEAYNFISTAVTQELTDRYSSALASLVWQAIGCVEEESSTGSLFEGDHPLAGISGAALLRFMWLFGRRLSLCDPSNPLFDASIEFFTGSDGRPPTIVRHADNVGVHGVLTAICQLLLGWPDTWFATLKRLVELEDQVAIGKRLPKALKHEFRGPEFEWLHSSFADFMKTESRINVSLYPWLRYQRRDEREQSSTPTLLSQQEVAQRLRTKSQKVKSLIDTGHLTTTPRPGRGSKREWALVTAESLLELEQKWADLLTLDKAVQFCQISKYTLLDLVAADLLDAAVKPKLEKTGTWRFTRVSLRETMQRIVGHLPLTTLDEARDLLTLSECARLLNWSSIGILEVLMAVRAGTLPAYRTKEVLPTFGDIWFQRSDVLDFTLRLRRVNNRELLTATELCSIFACKAETLRRLCSAGLLVPREERIRGTARVWLYDSKDVEEFKERYITTQEAADILGCGRLTVQHWAKSGRLPAITGPHLDGSHTYRFEKIKLIDWRRERLTVGEAAQLANVAPTRIQAWALQGKLVPLADMGGTQRWFSRRDVEQLCSL